MKALLWAVIGFLVVMWLLRGKAATGAHAARRDAADGDASGGDAAGGDAASRAAGNSEQMIRCAHCGVHMPASEAIVTTGAVFCSEEHRVRHAAR